MGEKRDRALRRVRERDAQALGLSFRNLESGDALGGHSVLSNGSCLTKRTLTEWVVSCNQLRYACCVLSRTYEGQVCSVARTLELIGERWTVLILREVFRGNRRFDQMQGALGIARNVLTARLEHLQEAGILERRRYQERPARYEYMLTEKGIDLWPVLMQMLIWGDKHLAEGGPPVYVEHRDCGGQPDEHLICDRCGEPLHARNVTRRPGPGLKAVA